MGADCCSSGPKQDAPSCGGPSTTNHEHTPGSHDHGLGHEHADHGHNHAHANNTDGHGHDHDHAHSDHGHDHDHDHDQAATQEHAHCVDEDDCAIKGEVCDDADCCDTDADCSSETLTCCDTDQEHCDGLPP